MKREPSGCPRLKGDNFTYTMSTASEPTHRNQQLKNTNFGLINHWKWQVYFDTLSVRHNCNRKNFKPLFSAGIALAIGVWNYTFYPMRMTNAILPKHTSLGTIKGSVNHARPLFFFQQQVETSWHEREHSLSILGQFQTADRGTFHLEWAHFNICSSASFRRPLLVNYFSLLNQMDPEASSRELNSCTAIYNCLSLFCNFLVSFV